MLKPLAVGLLTLSAACATVAFAHDSNGDHQVRWHDQSMVWCHEHCDRLDDQQGDKGDSTPAVAPEIDPAGALGALTLLSGGLAVIRGRRRSRAA